MFDVGFSELVLILVIALLVLGPERLPGAIRTTGLWVARLRRSFNDIRSEIEREVRFDEIKRDLHNQTILDSLKETGEEIGKLRDLPYDVSGIGQPRRPATLADPEPPVTPALPTTPPDTTSPDSPEPAAPPASTPETHGLPDPQQSREPRP